MSSLRDLLRPDIAFARVEFNMSHEEFMRQTPREWDDVKRAWAAKLERDERRENRRTARICMVLSWCHGNPSATEDDFIPKPFDPNDVQSEEEMIAALEGMNKHG